MVEVSDLNQTITLLIFELVPGRMFIRHNFFGFVNKKVKMAGSQFAIDFLKELESEIESTRKCIGRVPESLYDFKPHETSMKLGYLILLVAQIPKWFSIMIRDREINFQTYKQAEPKTTAEMVKHFDENISEAKDAFEKVTDEDLKKHFVLRNGDQVHIDSPIRENLVSTLNHWIHHRGQLTVYMRMNGIKVPSIYGPSADENW